MRAACRFPSRGMKYCSLSLRMKSCVAHSVESAFKSIAVIVRDRRRMYSETPCPECGEYSRSVHCRYVAEINMLAQYVPANDVGKQIGGH